MLSNLAEGGPFDAENQTTFEPVQDDDNEDTKDDDDHDDELHHTFDFPLSESESGTGVEGRQGFRAMFEAFLNAETSDPDTEGETEDEVDREMAEMQAEAKARVNPPEGDPPPKRTRGCTSKQGQEIIITTHELVGEFTEVTARRKDMARRLHHFERLSGNVAKWTLELQVKRLIFENLIVKRLKDGNVGWLSGDWPTEEEVQQLMDHSKQAKVNQPQGDADDDEEARAEQTELGSSYFSNSSDCGPSIDLMHPPLPEPAVEYRPPKPNASRGLNSSPLPPSSLRSYVSVRSPQPDPVTPPRRTQKTAPMAKQPELDSFDEPSPESPGTERHLKAFHPSTVVDGAEQQAQAGAGPSQQATKNQAGPASALPPDHVHWSPRRNPRVEEIGESISQIRHKNLKRRRDEVEEDDEAGAGGVEEYKSDSHARNSALQPTAGPSQGLGYVPKPVPSYNGHETSHEPYYSWAGSYTQPDDWRPSRGDNLKEVLPSPKRARRD
ncbi:hypothetical protein EVJ58_g1973 [Rhodofomes roseus]|uniref:Uncharacterized protein n=1 Tax=Rhodofomes roseus TaxID=34475 RepID=A0A4Y9YUQ2_9APHY|nr:hypothetical protein EVJ58_g1973 [Rhodofomes roseus]